MLIVNVHKQSR